MTVPSISSYCIVGWTGSDKQWKNNWWCFSTQEEKNFSHTCSQRFYLCILLFPCLLVNTLLEDYLGWGLSDSSVKQCRCVYYLCWYGNSLKRPHSSSDMQALDSISDKEGSSTWSAMLRKQLNSVSCNGNTINWLRQWLNYLRKMWECYCELQKNFIIIMFCHFVSHHFVSGIGSGFI